MRTGGLHVPSIYLFFFFLFLVRRKPSIRLDSLHFSAKPFHFDRITISTFDCGFFVPYRKIELKKKWRYKHHRIIYRDNSGLWREKEERKTSICSLHECAVNMLPSFSFQFHSLNVVHVNVCGLPLLSSVFFIFF